MADETTLPEKRPQRLMIEEPPYGGFLVINADYGLRSDYETPVVAAFSTLQEALDWIGRVYRSVE